MNTGYWVGILLYLQGSLHFLLASYFYEYYGYSVLFFVSAGLYAFIGFIIASSVYFDKKGEVS